MIEQSIIAGVCSALFALSAIAIGVMLAHGKNLYLLRMINRDLEKLLREFEQEKLRQANDAKTSTEILRPYEEPEN